MQLNSKSIQPGNLDGSNGTTLKFTSSHSKLYYIIARKDGVYHKILAVGELIGYSGQYKLDLKNYFVLNRPANLDFKMDVVTGFNFKNKEYQYIDFDGCKVRVLLHNTPIMTAVSSLLLPNNYINLSATAPVYSDLTFNYWKSLNTIEHDSKAYSNGYFSYTYSDISSTIIDNEIEQPNLVTPTLNAFTPYNSVVSKTIYQDGIEYTSTINPSNTIGVYCTGIDGGEYFNGMYTFSAYLKFEGQILPQLPPGFILQTYGQVLFTSYEPTTGKLFQIINFTSPITSFTWHTTPLIKPGGGFYQSFTTKNFKIEKGINYNSKWTPHTSESHHCVVQYIGNDVQFYNKGNVYLNGSRTFINRIAPNVDTIYVQGNRSKFIPVIKNCITPYLYYRGNGLGVLSVRGNVANVNRVEKEYLNFNNKKIPFKTINKTLKRLNTGFDLNETEVFDMINSGYLFELNLNNVNLVRNSDINLTITAYGAQFREMYLVKGRKYVFSVTARKTAPESYDAFSIIYDGIYIPVPNTSWIIFDYTKSTPFQVFTAPYSGLYRIISYTTANRPLYIWNYSVTEGDKLIPYTSGQINTNDFEPFKLTAKPYVINNSESDGYVGKNLSEKNIEIEIESIEDSEETINTQINFFD